MAGAFKSVCALFDYASKVCTYGRNGFHSTVVAVHIQLLVGNKCKVIDGKLVGLAQLEPFVLIRRPRENLPQQAD